MEAGSSSRTRSRPRGGTTPPRGPPRWGEDLIKGLLVLAALISVLTTTGIVLSLLEETIAFFGDVPIGDFLFGTEWTPLFEPPSFGVLPLVIGTLSSARSRWWWPRRSGSAPPST